MEKVPSSPFSVAGTSSPAFLAFGLSILLHPSPDPPAGCFPGGCVLEVAGGASKATDKEEDWVYLPFPVSRLSFLTLCVASRPSQITGLSLPICFR